ncbi:NADH-quinone oxidoreductase subunit N [Gemmata sp. SH-PL17]|uniref:NADH-quinone oxidoreductase subunit N n=1 Tax=Gemmata sp. SH-PL17 TaxID=1630693 RepID=UPI00078C4285|nr:NADH-quinone oxidoreductase subunit N [Gemmata sp. SH-PL17]AMV25841.1 NADH-quinone oxidoreductase subunit N [Gemmata sp. SH-PL17]
MTDPLLQQTLKGVFQLAVPEIALVGTACVVFLFGCVYNRRCLWFGVSLAGVALAAVLAATVETEPPALLTVAPLVPDGAAAFVRWVALITAAVLLFVSWAEVDGTNAAEYYGCLLVAAAGVSLVGRANDLITLFLSLELLSIPTYILLYLPARNKLNQEAAAKYFLLSVMSSAVMLFGFSYLYGLTGSTNLAVITDALTKTQSADVQSLNPMALVGAVLVIAAIGFRITAVPFHFYAPDVYEGAPAGVVAQLAFFPKLAGFVALARILGLLGADVRHIPFDTKTQLPLLLWILAAMTMCIGNVLALLQDNVRRMLAYSSVAHGGYMLMGIVVASSLPDAIGQPGIGGIDALLVYIVAYGMMTVGSFAVILYLGTPDQPIESIDDLAGASQSHPVAAGAMTVFLFSLIGLPLTAGFAGKFLLFVGAFSAPTHTAEMRNLYQIMAVIAAINAAVGAYYYLRVVGVMYLRTPLRPATRTRAVPTFVAAVTLAAATLFFGIYPEPIVRAARKAAPVPGAPAQRITAERDTK